MLVYRVDSWMLYILFNDSPAEQGDFPDFSSMDFPMPVLIKLGLLGLLGGSDWATFDVVFQRGQAIFSILQNCTYQAEILLKSS